MTISVSSSYNRSQWDNSVLDPRLINSRSSELAGALTLPSQIPPGTVPSRSSSPNGQFSVTVDDPCASSGSQAPGADRSMDVDVQHIYKACDTASSAPLGPVRYCSVKGCKAAIPNNYFFKMCEPCRDRYRAYGITKRAKCRAERVAANTELEALRIEEDKRRAEEGLPVRSLNISRPPSLNANIFLSSLWQIAPKTGLPGRTTLWLAHCSPTPKTNMVHSLLECVRSPIAMQF